MKIAAQTMRNSVTGLYQSLATTAIAIDNTDS